MDFSGKSKFYVYKCIKMTNAKRKKKKKKERKEKKRKCILFIAFFEQHSLSCFNWRLIYFKICDIEAKFQNELSFIVKTSNTVMLQVLRYTLSCKCHLIISEKNFSIYLIVIFFENIWIYQNLSIKYKFHFIEDNNRFNTELDWK